MSEMFPSWSQFAVQWLSAMGRASLYGAVALTLVWAVGRCFPRLPARWRCWLWRLAFLKLALCLVLPGTLDLPILPRSFGPGATVAAKDTKDTAVRIRTSPGSTYTTVDVPALDGSAAHSPARAATDSTHPTRTPLSTAAVVASVLFGAWAAMVAALAGLIAIRVFAARRWRRRCVLIKDPAILTLGEELARRFGLVQPPLLFSADFCTSPVVFGALRTAVVLPDVLVEKMTPGELRLVLAHEMAHIRRGDLLGNWFVSIVSGLFFFHPLVWVAFRETRLAQETACDELAVGLSGGSVVDYGKLIVELATRCWRPASPVVAVGVVESFQNSLARRLRAMKTFGTESLPVAMVSWLLAVVAVVGLLPWRVVAQDGDSDEAKAARAEDPAGNDAEKNPFAPVRAKAGEYTVIVDAARPAEGQMRMESTGFPMIPDKVSADSGQVTRSGSSGGASWNAAAGGGGMGMGGGYAGAYTKPNLILDVKVEPSMSHAERGTHLLCEVNGKVRAVDDEGNEFDSPGTPAMLRNRFVEMTYPKGSGRTAIHLYRPPQSSGYLKSLDGELYVAAVKQRRCSFTGKDLSRKTTKRAGKATVRLQSVKTTPEGIDVALTFSEAAPRGAGNPLEQMRRLMSSRNRLSVTIEDSKGQTYRPTQTESSAGGSGSWKSGGGSGGGAWGASGGGVSGSGGGSFGPGGSGGSTHGSGGGAGPGGTFQTFGGSSSGGSEPGQRMRFAPLPEGTTLKAVHCTVTDHLGEPKAVAFHLENIRLP